MDEIIDAICANDTKALSKLDVNVKLQQDHQMSYEGRAFFFGVGSTALHIAIALNKPDCINSLIKGKVQYDTNKAGTHEIHMFALVEDETTIKRFVPRFEKMLTAQTKDGLTVAHLCALFNNISLYKFLRDKYSQQMQQMLLTMDKTSQLPYELAQENKEVFGKDFRDALTAARQAWIQKPKSDGLARQYTSLLFKRQDLCNAQDLQTLTVYNYKKLRYSYSVATLLLMALSLVLLSSQKQQLAFLIYLFVQGYASQALDSMRFLKSLIARVCEPVMVLAGYSIIQCVLGYHLQQKPYRDTFYDLISQDISRWVFWQSVCGAVSVAINQVRELAPRSILIGFLLLITCILQMIKPNRGVLTAGYYVTGMLAKAANEWWSKQTVSQPKQAIGAAASVVALGGLIVLPNLPHAIWIGLPLAFVVQATLRIEKVHKRTDVLLRYTGVTFLLFAAHINAYNLSGANKVTLKDMLYTTVAQLLLSFPFAASHYVSSHRYTYASWVLLNSCAVLYAYCKIQGNKQLGILKGE